jgi:PBP1b-binding outer membrane lipoprotein LpoB
LLVSGISVNKKISFLIFIMLMALLIAGCSTDNSSGKDQSDASKPQPQVRVVVNPTATASPSAPPVENTPSAAEPSATVTAPEQVLTTVPEPTADEDAIANQIESLMDDMDKKLNSADYTFGK